LKPGPLFNGQKWSNDDARDNALPVKIKTAVVGLPKAATSRSISIGSRALIGLALIGA
jgi:hypothetical protein